MGTDVHASIQYRAKNEETGADEWRFCDHNYESNRHYKLFAWIADVRNGYGFAGCDTGDAIKPIAEPRGLPEDNIYATEPTVPYEYNNPQWREYWARGGEDYGDHSYTWLMSTEILQAATELKGTVARGVMPLSEYLKWDKVSEPDSYSGGVGGGGNVTINHDQVTRGHIKADAYSRALFSDIAKRWRANMRKIRFVQELRTPDEQRGWFSTTTYRCALTGRLKVVPQDRTNATLVYVPKHTTSMRPSKLKHLRKLERYAKRAGKVNVRCEWFINPEEQRQSFAYFIDEIQRLHDLHGEVRFVCGFDS
jgi:hypothetical protein